MPGHALLAVQLADDPADRVDLQLHDPGAAAQRRSWELLNARAADPDARERQHRVVARVGVARGRHVADDMRELVAERVEPGGAGIDEDARQIGRVHLDLRHLLPGQELAHHGRDEAAVAVHLPLDPRALVLRERDEAGEVVEREAEILGLLGDQQGPPVQLVARHHRAEPVEDAAARRGDQPGADAVLLGERGVAGPSTTWA